MSDVIFPSLPGQAWPVVKAPKWSTKVQTTASGRETRASFYASPRWHIKVSFAVLRQNEMQQLAGFFNARRGSWDTFLFYDPQECQVSGQPFGLGNGVTSRFQLLRSVGGFVEPVFGLKEPPQIMRDGVLLQQGTDYTVDNMATVTFVVPPGANTELTWSGKYCFRCRFQQDQAEFEQFMSNLWALKRVELLTVKP